MLSRGNKRNKITNLILIINNLTIIHQISKDDIELIQCMSRKYIASKEICWSDFWSYKNINLSNNPFIPTRPRLSNIIKTSKEHFSSIYALSSSLIVSNVFPLPMNAFKHSLSYFTHTTYLYSPNPKFSKQSNYLISSFIIIVFLINLLYYLLRKYINFT